MFKCLKIISVFDENIYLFDFLFIHKMKFEKSKLLFGIVELINY